jgi:surface protein
MYSMFYDSSHFNQDIGQWNTSSVSDMSYMFAYASDFNQHIGQWDTSRVSSMYGMFYRASDFNQNLCAWKYNFPYGYSSGDIFYRTSCTYTATPVSNASSFCAAGPDCTTTPILPTLSPTKVVTTNPTPSPTYMPGGPPFSCYPNASEVRLNSLTGVQLQMIEVQVFSAGINVAEGKPARQSSTYRNFKASRAVDGKGYTFSHTNDTRGGDYPWWEVYLEASYPIELVKIINRWCGDESDPGGCLCRLSYSTLSLFDGEKWVVTKVLGDTCTTLEWTYVIPTSPALCAME